MALPTRLLGVSLDRARQAEDLRVVRAPGGVGIGQGHLALGEPARLVEHDRVDALGALEHLAAQDEHSH